MDKIVRPTDAISSLRLNRYSRFLQCFNVLHHFRRSVNCIVVPLISLYSFIHDCSFLLQIFCTVSTRNQQVGSCPAQHVWLIPRSSRPELLIKHFYGFINNVVGLVTSIQIVQYHGVHKCVARTIHSSTSNRPHNILGFFVAILDGQLVATIVHCMMRDGIDHICLGPQVQRVMPRNVSFVLFARQQVQLNHNENVAQPVGSAVKSNRLLLLATLLRCGGGIPRRK
mmetsp:Transcript_17165/g.25419  ORF Transcript_17165/g.25419 Transcript_17165/m.25419 type:complete len:226 (+) Transcript_17165:112-789(+)